MSGLHHAGRRKGVEMSLNLVILIVIALVVAAILLYIVVKNTRGADKDLSSCEAKGGHCEASASDCRSGETASGFFGASCDSAGDVCCLGSIQDNP